MPHDPILALDDATAGRILSTFVATRINAPKAAELSPTWQSALEETFDLEPSGRPPISEGDLARQALRLLAEIPENRKPLAELISGAGPELFGGGLETLAVITAAIFVLKSHVLLERDADGKVHLLFESQPLPVEILKPFVEKLLDFTSMGTPKAV